MNMQLLILCYNLYLHFSIVQAFLNYKSKKKLKQKKNLNFFFICFASERERERKNKKYDYFAHTFPLNVRLLIQPAKPVDMGLKFQFIESAISFKTTADPPS